MIDFQQNDLADLFDNIGDTFNDDTTWMNEYKDRNDNIIDYMNADSCTSDCCTELNTGSDTSICGSGDWGSGSIDYTYSASFTSGGGDATANSEYFDGSNSPWSV